MIITNTGCSDPITTRAESTASGEAYLVRKNVANEITVSRINSQNLRDFSKLPILISCMSCETRKADVSRLHTSAQSDLTLGLCGCWYDYTTNADLLIFRSAVRLACPSTESLSHKPHTRLPKSPLSGRCAARRCAARRLRSPRASPHNAGSKTFSYWLSRISSDTLPFLLSLVPPVGAPSGWHSKQVSLLPSKRCSVGIPASVHCEHQDRMVSPMVSRSGWAFIGFCPLQYCRP